MNKHDQRVNDGKNRPILSNQFISGVLAGAVSTLCVHPLDLVKIRFQVHDGKHSRDMLPAFPTKLSSGRFTSNLISRFYHQFFSNPMIHYGRYTFEYVGSIYKTGKGFDVGLVGWLKGMRNCYQGLSPNLFGATLSWGSYFYFYSVIKEKLLRKEEGFSPQLGFHEYFFASFTASVLTLSLTNPIWVIKTRICLQNSSQAISAIDHFRYTGILDAFLKITRHEGLYGLYSGFIPGLMGACHGGIQFMIYENLKSLMHKRKAEHSSLSNLDYIFMSGVSKLTAGILTYPYQVIRSRLQDVRGDTTQVPYNGFTDVIRKMIQVEGISGFYRGLIPNLIRMLPGSMITFLVYENSIHFLSNSNKIT